MDEHILETLKATALLALEEDSRTKKDIYIQRIIMLLDEADIKNKAI